jgi:hypothetical protein
MAEILFLYNIISQAFMTHLLTFCYAYINSILKLRLFQESENIVELQIQLIVSN